MSILNTARADLPRNLTEVDYEIAVAALKAWRALNIRDTGAGMLGVLSMDTLGTHITIVPGDGYTSVYIQTPEGIAFFQESGEERDR